MDLCETKNNGKESTEANEASKKIGSIKLKEQNNTLGDNETINILKQNISEISPLSVLLQKY